MKAFISGGGLSVRPNFGIEAVYVAYIRTGKWMETNYFLPSIKASFDDGPWDEKMLYSFIRRLRVLELSSVFTSNPDDVDIEKKLFLDDEGLESFFGRRRCQSGVQSVLAHALLAQVQCNGLCAHLEKRIG